MNKTNNGNYAVAKKVNQSLQAMPANDRPELETRKRVAMVAYSARGFFECLDTDGHAVMVSGAVVSQWAK